MLASLAGCAAEEHIGKAEEALSVPGPWVIPDDTLAAGDDQDVPYTGAGPWVGSDACSGSLTPGARVLREWLMRAFPQVESIGGYSCRAIVGDSTRMSVHGTGRALDIMLPLHAGAADNDLGDPIGEWLIEHAELIGIQYIIWDRWTWMAERPDGSKDREYGGTHPHHDHLHVELSLAGAAMRTPWFSGSMSMPESDCAALPADGGIVDETSSCFAAYGPSTYWRRVAGDGHDGSLLWTNAFQSDSPSNWARWHLALAEAGTYAVEVWIEPEYGVHASTHYAVRHDAGEVTLRVDQSSASGWVRLGVFDFAAGTGQHVSVYDATPAAVAPDQHIAVDALRLVRDDGAMPGVAPGVDVAQVVWPETPMMDGDPSLDDDPPVADEDELPPVRHGATIEGGCSTSSRGAGAPEPLVAVLALALVAIVRRRR